MHDALELIPDDALPTTVRRLTAHSSVALADLLAHLGEVERRGIHRERACASLYTYCVYELRMSEDAAFRRAKAARIVRRYPEVREAIAKGEIHLTGLHYKVQFTASQKYLDLLEEAIALLGHESPRPALPDVQLRALELLVSKLRKDRRGAREAKRAREGGGHRAGAGVVTAMRRVRRRAGAGVAALAARFQWALHPAERPAHRVESRQRPVRLRRRPGRPVPRDHGSRATSSPCSRSRRTEHRRQPRAPLPGAQRARRGGGFRAGP